MRETTTLPAIGPARSRADGRAKVTGTATYAAEFEAARLAHAVMALSTIASGRVASIDVAEAARLPGVVAIYTHENAPPVKQEKPAGAPVDRNLPLLQDDLVRYDRQPVALVVAETLEIATDAASRLRIRYAFAPAALDFHAPAFTPPPDMHGTPDSLRGDPEKALAGAAVSVDHVYVTPREHHNPMEPHATLASWEGDVLTVHDATQGVFGTQKRLAAAFGIPVANVRVLSPFLGGGFGCKGSVWPHTALAALAARALQRPVRLALERPQMFGSVGWRPQTEQRVALGAAKDGTLVATIHDARTNTSTFDDFVEPSALMTRMLYASPNLRTTQRVVRMNVSTPTFMRAPGESSGSFALESAMDELAIALAMDPLALRLKNYAETDPEKGIPFSSKSLRACYAQAAERFGWSRRTGRPRSVVVGTELVGLGMATASYPTNRGAAGALVRVASDGSVDAQAGTQDLGTGAYTVFTQVTAETLGVPPERVRFSLGDTNMPSTPVSGGSQTTASVGSAVFEAARDARNQVLALALGDAASPLFKASPAEVSVAEGRFFLTASPPRGETYAEILARHPMATIEGRANAAPAKDAEARHSMHAFGAQFAEVRVDVDTGMIRVAKMTSAFASGRILNRKTATSQYIGGMTFGIGMALHEITRSDARSGRIMNANLGEYLLPTHADVPDLEAILVEETDEIVNPIGVKGIGEIGIVGAAAAIANAVYDATGVRVRDLPITPDKLLLT